MLYEQDVYWSNVDVADVAESVYRAATLTNLHGKNYLIASESYRISDVSLLLNGETPAGQARSVYSSALATRELGVQFNPLSVTFGHYVQATKEPTS